jgi:hypothetical protein
MCTLLMWTLSPADASPPGALPPSVVHTPCLCCISSIGLHSPHLRYNTHFCAAFLTSVLQFPYLCSSPHICTTFPRSVLQSPHLFCIPHTCAAFPHLYNIAHICAAFPTSALHSTHLQHPLTSVYLPCLLPLSPPLPTYQR